MKNTAVAISLLAAGLCPTAALAADAEANSESSAGIPTESNDVDVAFTPYLWIAGVKADVALPRGEGEAEIDKSFTDTLSNLKFAFMGTLDIRYNRFVALVDVVYLSVGAHAEGIRDPQFLEGHIDSSTFVSTIEGGYRVVDQGGMSLDLVGGVRISSLYAKVELEGPLQERTRKKTVTQVAPIVGARVRVPVGERTALALYGDVGVSDADVKYQIFGNVQHDISRHWRLMAGYRYMSIRHDKSDFDLDMSLSGPVIGATYKF